MLEENMLKAYINMSVNIKENRLLKDVTFNEMMIMNILVEREISFKELQQEMNMLKSQLNKIINTMKAKGLVESYIPTNDKRMLMLKAGSNLSLYDEEHKKMLFLMNQIIKKIGKDESIKLIELLNTVTKTIKENTND